MTSMSEVETKSTAMWLFDGILACVEYIGEGVATVMGLNESKYQYVIDSMSENDWYVYLAAPMLRSPF